MRLDKQIEEQIEKAMNLNKQVDDMARDLCGNDVDCNKCTELMPCFSRYFSKRAVAKGYRLASDVAREIIEEAEKIFMATCTSLEAYTTWQNFKKQYTEEVK